MADEPRRYRSALITGGSLPLTPLIDVVFLIVVFFMINATFAVHSVIPVELPGADAGAVAGARALVITVAADGRIFVEHAGATSAVALPDLRDLLPGADHGRVVLRGDARAPYGRLVEVLDAVRAAGVTDLELVTVTAPTGS